MYKKFRRISAVYTLTSLGLLSVLLMSTSAFAFEDICDIKLGRDYDQIPTTEKAVRINGYFNCRYSQDFRFLQKKHTEILKKIKQWRNRAGIVTDDSWYTQIPILRKELQTVHFNERFDFDAKYDKQFAALEITKTTENRIEIRRKQREISLERNTERPAMMSRQTQENNQLEDNLNQCSASVKAQLNQSMAADVTNINQQFLEKSAVLKKEHDHLRDTPIHQK